MTDDTALTPAQQMLGDFAPGLLQITHELQFREVWPPNHHNPRERIHLTLP